MNYYIRALKNYTNFEGRDTRPQYWYFYLFSLIVAIILGIIEKIINTNALGYIYALVVLIPSIAIAARRLHDIGKSGWWLLIALIPIIGWIWIIVLLASKGEDKPNKYGSVPKIDEIKEELQHEEVKHNEHENKEDGHSKQG